MGNQERLRNIAEEINSLLKVPDSVQVTGLDMCCDREAVFEQAVDKAWQLLGSLDSFVNCYDYEGKLADMRCL